MAQDRAAVAAGAGGPGAGETATAGGEEQGIAGKDSGEELVINCWLSEPSQSGVSQQISISVSRPLMSLRELRCFPDRDTDVLSY